MSHGDYFKKIENDIETKILPYIGYMVRLDGKNFSRFTKGFKKPFDELLTKTMVKVSKELLNTTHAKTVFYCSDEITLLFSPVCTKDDYDNKKNTSTHQYNGRIIKNCSVLSSLCSVYFNKFLGIYMKEFLKNDKNNTYSQNFIEKCLNGIQIFDARMFPYKDIDEAYKNLEWRSLYDCKRNSISQYARYYLGKKDIINKKGKEMIMMMKEKGYNWEEFPLELRYGVLLKKELKFLINVHEGKENGYYRTVPVAKTYQPVEFLLLLKDILEDKYWNKENKFGNLIYENL